MYKLPVSSEKASFPTLDNYLTELDPRTTAMTSSPHKLWADSPIALIPTPLGNEDLAAGKAHGSRYLAQQMTHLHNMLLRVLNSIYNQAPYVSTPSDIKDFLSLVNHWRDELDHHHLTEEKCFFPAVEAATGLKGIMEANVEQHHLFEPGLEALGKYATETSVEDYDGKKLQAIIDEFGVILSKHLNEEIETLISLKEYDDKASDILGYSPIISSSKPATM